MRLKDKDMQPAMDGLPASYREWWDLGGGYEVFITFGKRCKLVVDDKKIHRDITLEIARCLGVDMDEKKMIKILDRSEELYLTLGIDCVVLNYSKPENYKELLEKIEEIVNTHFKPKDILDKNVLKPKDTTIKVIKVDDFKFKNKHLVLIGMYIGPEFRGTIELESYLKNKLQIERPNKTKIEVDLKDFDIGISKSEPRTVHLALELSSTTYTDKDIPRGSIVYVTLPFLEK